MLGQLRPAFQDLYGELDATETVVQPPLEFGTVTVQRLIPRTLRTAYRSRGSWSRLARSLTVSPETPSTSSPPT